MTRLSQLTARLKVVWNSSADDNCFERIARAVRTEMTFFQRTAWAIRTRTDDNFSRMDSSSKGWNSFFERITSAVKWMTIFLQRIAWAFRTDTKSLENPFTSVSNFVTRNSRDLCSRRAMHEGLQWAFHSGIDILCHALSRAGVAVVFHSSLYTLHKPRSLKACR